MGRYNAQQEDEELERWLNDRAAAAPAYQRPRPDMAFTPQEAEHAPDMTFGIDEAEGRGRFSNTSKPVSAGSQQFAPPPPMAAPPQSRLSSLIQPRDTQMDDRWRRAENSALDRSGYLGDQKYGAGEAVRDFAPMAIGGALDIFLNKGRGIGNIVSGGMQANQIEEGNRKKQAAAAGDFAAQARNQRESAKNGGLDAAYKDAQIQRWENEAQRGDANVAAREREIKIREAKAAYDRDPTDPQAQRMAAIVQQETGVDVTGLGNQAQGRIMGVAKGTQALNNAGPTADARNESDLRYANPTAAATAVGKEEGQLAAAPVTAAKNAALGQVTEADTNAQNYATQFAKDNEAPMKIGLALQDIVRGPNGEPAPGLDPAHRIGSKIPGATALLPGEFPQAVQKVLQNLDLAEEAYARDQSGAAIGVKEGAKFLRQVIGNPLSKAEDVQAAIERFNERNNEYLRARSAGNPEAAGRVFSAAGLNIGPATPRTGAPTGGGGVSRETPAGSPRTRMAPQRPGRTQEGTAGDGFGSNVAATEGLPTTGRVGPKVSAVPGQRSAAVTTPPAGGGAPRMRIIEDPKTGETESEMMSDDEVKAFMASNPGINIR